MARTDEAFAHQFDGVTAADLIANTRNTRAVREQRDAEREERAAREEAERIAALPFDIGILADAADDAPADAPMRMPSSARPDRADSITVTRRSVISQGLRSPNRLGSRRHLDPVPYMPGTGLDPRSRRRSQELLRLSPWRRTRRCYGAAGP